MILVTGGTGFVGRRLVNLLSGAGTPVRVLTRTPDRAALPSRVETVAGELGDPAALARAVAGVEAVVHLAAQLAADHAHAADVERVNAEGARALAVAAARAAVPRFVHGSSAGVYGDGVSPAPHRETDAPHPGNAYERSKLAGEEALREALAGSRVRWTILRPAGVYGPGRPATGELFREVAHRRLWLHGPARVLVHPTYVDDVVSAIRLVLGRDDLTGETFNVGGERALDYAELIALIGVAMGRRPRQLRAPRWTGVGARAAAALLNAAFGRAPARLARLGLPLVNRAVDTAKARRVLGFSPTALTHGLAETAAALKNGGPA